MSEEQKTLPNMVWIDLETTGLDPIHDIVLEVGCVITDQDLNEITADSWLVSPKGRMHAYTKMDEHVREMHQKNGLLEQIATVIERGHHDDHPWAVADFVQKFIEANGGKGSPMCGSSVHFDRAMITSNLPSLIHRDVFSHRNIDVSTIKELAKRWGGRAWNPAGARSHRGLDDIRNSLDELRWYRKHYFNFDDLGTGGKS